MNGGKVGTINKQVNSLPRRTSRKIKRVNYAENSNRVNSTGKRTLPDEYEVYKTMLVNILRFTYH